jgi:SAM-dependent methyltransferase
VAPAPDAASFRTSPDAYDRHVGRYGPSLSAAFADFAGPLAAARVLDVGCGPGALTAELAERLGPECVAAAEPSEPWAQACRARVPGADVRVASADRLPFDDDAFAAVVSQLVVNFLPDAGAGVAEMRRVSVPGGTVAACVWDYAEGMTMLRTFWDAATAIDPGAAKLDEGRRMPYCQPRELEALWREGGLSEVSTAALASRASYRDFDDLWEPLTHGVGPSGAYCASLAPADRERLRDEWRERLGRPDGPFELEARAWAVRGAAP